MYTPKLICLKYELPSHLQGIRVTRDCKSLQEYEVYPDGRITLKIEDKWYDEEYIEATWTGKEWVTNVEGQKILKSAYPLLSQIVKAHRSS